MDSVSLKNNNILRPNQQIKHIGVCFTAYLDGNNSYRAHCTLRLILKRITLLDHSFWFGWYNSSKIIVSKIQM